MKTTNRFSCKCVLCKAKWTTEERDRTRAFSAHEKNCPRYSTIFARRRAQAPRYSEESERYQMAALYFHHLPIVGHYNASVKCNARCTGATGHLCECSCGGVNHGAAQMA